MVARDLRSISIVEGAGFKHLLNYVEPGYTPSLHTDIVAECCHLYDSKKKRFLKEIIDCEYVVLTTDIWMSAAIHGYMTVTVHFIDKLWQLGSQMLVTEEMLECHTG